MTRFQGLQKRVAQLSTVAVGLFAALPALAEEAAHGEHHAETVSSLGWPFVNFAIFAFIIRTAYRKKIAPTLQQRSVEFQQLLQKAGSELADVEREVSVVTAQLSRLDQERAEIAQQLHREGEQVAIAVIEGARNEAKKIEADALRQRDHELKRVQKELRNVLIERAVARAKEKAQARVSADDDRRLRDDVLSSLVN